jgi:hypothetical protein
MPLYKAKAFLFTCYMIHWLENHLFPCFFKSHFGIECPGCGMQRSLISLLKGNLSESLNYHVALIPFIITIILLLVQLKTKHVNGGKWVMWAFIVTSTITILQYVVRQIILFNH